MNAGNLDSSGAVTGLGDDVDVVLRTKHQSETASHQRLIIDDGNLD